ncbi:nuclear transcription factor Y subunit B-9-like [Cornus florida]|uniref:nuclear transcription factor Y subunit B-9-like n=1 Tax=Cornus florida TaxID=4283 RepID=UPI0028A25F13|nr:nuclear transcription factor Y subunit B-9-like [Cornus florida]
MERGEGSHGCHRNPRSSSSAAKSRNNDEKAPKRSAREQDQYMPIANVIRIMRCILPPHAKISDDVKETIQECVSEYISFITSEANVRCRHEQRKTITAEDVLWAMGRLGFDNYVDPLTVFLNRYREAETQRTSLRGEPNVKRTVNFGGGGAAAAGTVNYGAAFPQRENIDAATILNAYLRDGSSGGGGSNSQANFDPFHQFK